MARGKPLLLTPGMKTAQRVAFVTVAATLVLIMVGVIVRATSSGLGCPDWPLCHGGAVPPGQKHSLIEFSHRFTAMIVGFLVIGTAVLAWKTYRHAPLTVWAATIAVPMVGFQGILGAITVKRELPAEVVATHLVTAMLVLSIELFVALSMYLEDPDHSKSALVRVGRQISVTGRLAVGAAAYLATLMWVGAYMAESGASTACKGWPACNGSILPANNGHEITHMLHRYLAAGFIFLLVPFIISAWKRRGDLPAARYLAIAAGVLYISQVTVGAFNVWFTFPDILTVTHTAIATLVWSVLSTAAIISFYVPQHERHRYRARAEAPA